MNNEAQVEAAEKANLIAMQKWINQNTGKTTSTPHQAGGWTTMSGPGEDGKPEYVLSNPTAMALQSKLGSLSQANLLSAVLAGRGGGSGGQSGSNVHITVQGGSLTMSQVYEAMDNMMDQKLGDLLPAFGN